MRRIFDFFCVRRNFEEDNDNDVGSPSRFVRGRASVALRSRVDPRVDPRGAKEKARLPASRFFF